MQASRLAINGRNTAIKASVTDQIDVNSFYASVYDNGDICLKKLRLTQACTDDIYGAQHAKITSTAKF